MADIAAQLVSVERVLWSGRAKVVTAQTVEGEVGILPGHEPMLGQLLDNGVVTITTPNDERKVAACQGGFLSVTSDKITILAEYATWASEVDAEQARRELSSSDKTTKARAEAELNAIKRSRS